MRFNPVGRLWEIASETVTRWYRNDGPMLAASMAYYAAFSFFPLLMVLVAALGFALKFSLGAQNAQEQLLSLLSQNASPELANEVSHLLNEVQAQAPVSGPVGLFTLLLGAIGVFTQLDTAFDRIWQTDAPHRWGIWAAVRNALVQRLKAFLVLIALGLLVIVAFFSGVLLAALRGWAGNMPVVDYGWHYLQLGTSLVLNAVVFTLLYRVLPKAQVRWRDALWGGITVAILWQFGSQALSIFFVWSSYTAYGVVGSFILMMLWVYCASTLMFVGAQLVQVLGSRAKERNAKREAYAAGAG